MEHRLPMLFDKRHMAVRKADLDKAIAEASKALDDAGDGLSLSKAGLMTKPPIIAVADIYRDSKAAEKGLKTVKEIFT